jgi:hypothetical protein
MRPSEIAAIMTEKDREVAYRKAVKDGNFQDSLSTRISARVNLSLSEQESLLGIIGKYCMDKTKRGLARVASYVPDIRNYGIYRRVLFEDGQANYCAGQSYPDEIRIVRKLLVG